MVDPLLYDPALADAGSGDVGGHEFDHAIIGYHSGTGIDHISLNPERDSLGHVQFTSQNLLAAVGPAANDRMGTGSDLASVRAAGKNPDDFKSGARTILAMYRQHAKIIIPILKAKRYMTGGEFSTLVTHVDKLLREGNTLSVRIVDPKKGIEKKITQKVKKDGTLTAQDIPVRKDSVRPVEQNQNLLRKSLS